MVQVVLPNGSEISVEQATAGEVAAKIGPGLAKAALAARVGDQVVGLDFELSGEGSVPLQIFTKKDPEALNVMRHSAAHVMARAVMRLWEGVQLGFGPTIEGGFYYDFELEHQISEDDFPAIETEMRKIVDEGEPFVRSVEPREQAIEICGQLKQVLKVEHIETGLSEEETLSFYRQGEFLDLCRGPHVPSAKAIAAFKILSVAGAYWKGDATKQQMQRLYATAFFGQTELDLHLKRLKQAQARDHRVLGKQLDLFAVSPLVGAGLILWLPKGAILRDLMQQFIQSELRKRGYLPVFTPNIGRVELYEISGHFPYYSDSQYAPIVMNEGERYLLKPMNCPHHVMIYKSKPRSYRELPMRLAEFGTVYRYEQSGEVSGMTRVRGFTQDDAHIFCTEDQVEEEIRSCIEMTKFMLKTLGLTDYRIRLGFRDAQSDKYVGSDASWERAQQSLRDVCAGLNIEAKETPGEAAFYGPKADFIIHDCIGREWQLGTVQVDYNLPSEERFALEYIGADNHAHRPVMIHRAPLGSMERFTAILIEHFAGQFPLWLSPEQMRVVPVSEKSEVYGRQIEQKLTEAGFRVSGDYRSDKLGAKVRDGELAKTPYLLVVGPRDEVNQTVSVRDTFAVKSADKDLGAMTIDNVIARFQKEVAEKTIRHAPDFEAVAAPGE